MTPATTTATSLPQLRPRRSNASRATASANPAHAVIRMKYATVNAGLARELDFELAKFSGAGIRQYVCESDRAMSGVGDGCKAAQGPPFAHVAVDTQHLRGPVPQPLSQAIATLDDDASLRPEAALSGKITHPDIE